MKHLLTSLHECFVIFRDSVTEGVHGPQLWSLDRLCQQIIALDIFSWNMLRKILILDGNKKTKKLFSINVFLVQEALQLLCKVDVISASFLGIAKSKNYLLLCESWVTAVYDCLPQILKEMRDCFSYLSYLKPLCFWLQHKNSNWQRSQSTLNLYT